MMNTAIASAKAGELTPQFWWIMALVVAVPIIIRLVDILNDHLDGRYWLEMDNFLQVLYYRKRSSLDVAALKKPEVQNKAQKAQETIGKTKDYSDRIFYSIGSFAGLLTAFAIFSTQNWWIFPLVVVATIPSLITETKYGRRVWGIWDGNTEARRRYNYYINRLYDADSLAENKLLGTVNHFISLIEKTLGIFTREQIEADKKAMPARTLSAVFSHGTTAILLVFFAVRAAHNTISIGELTFLYFTLSNLRGTISSLFSMAARQFKDDLYISDLFELLDAQPVLIQPTNPITLPATLTPSIEFKKVSFSYPSAPDIPVLNNISLTVPSGSRVAIIGHNGAGKSTLLSLAFRFYDPESGVVEIGGIDARELDLESWFARIGYIPQNYQYFQMQASDVIALGDTSRTKDERRVKQAGIRSGVDSFINSWPKKYNQTLGQGFEGGVDVSRGQMQKLALARMFYRDPRVWILDEPTSSVDARSEIEIFEELNALPKDRTIVFISHRFSTVRNADIIVVLDKGKVKEQGSHKELLKKHGLYATLFQEQAKAYK
jgi:ATP-binding cassette subfamily B protein